MSHPIALEDIIAHYQPHLEFQGVQIVDVNQRGLDETMLHIAARIGAVGHVKALIAYGADIDAIGDLGHTPLHDAALGGQAETAEILLDAGARTDLRNELGQTALELALIGGKQAVAQVLTRVVRDGRRHERS